jgi:hypothetical protein
VKKVIFYSDLPTQSSSWSTAEIDGTEIRIDVS